MKTRIAALATLVALAPGAHAVSLEFLTAGISGSRFAEVVAGTDAVSFASSLTPQITPTRIEGSGMSAGNIANLNGGVVSHGAGDSIHATLTGSPSGLVFSASAFSFLGMTGIGQLQQTSEIVSLDLRSDLRLAPSTEAIGTPVTIRLSGSGFTTFSAPGIAADDLGTFDVRVIAADGTLLAAHSASASDQIFDLSFAAAVGDEMELQVRHDRATSFLGSVDITSGTKHMVSAAALEGSFTVTPVPEPGTWTLIFGGLGLMALVSRRRA